MLDLLPSLRDLYRSSPFLFWTIIIISSRHHTQHLSIFGKLRPAYEQLLASHVVRAIHSIHTIHAILPLLSWPLPVKAQPEDPSWNFCGLITNAARVLGYHEPGREKEYGFPRATSNDIALRSKTWLDIFHKNMTLVSRHTISMPLFNLLQI